MPITANTKLFVVGRDGLSEMTLSGLASAFVGGLDPRTVEITLDHAEVKRLAAKQRAIARITELVGNMTPDQAEKAVDVLQARDHLMELHEPYL